MFTQLNPPLPLHVLGKGDGYAIGMIDYGQEHNLIWVTAIDGTGEIWCAPNPKVRMQQNWSMGRKESPLVAASKRPAQELCSDCSEAVSA
ncbi:MAG: hypothetical protein P0Y56_03985 [Candidatus Andeanibacterium colombiense]|uniref:Uncharacterized protein n=1 Tax=Candidatus Andeanibacterium colombiense TaxID=3121345 RepID=A0AAJ5X7J7_9SPHN|nr:MAG: hypothetical protein P0Y56_03985 [Sphingomonadaceae bacterium]